MDILFRGQVIKAELVTTINGVDLADFNIGDRHYLIALDNPLIWVIPERPKATTFQKFVTAHVATREASGFKHLAQAYPKHPLNRLAPANGLCPDLAASGIAVILKDQAKPRTIKLPPIDRRYYSDATNL